METGTKSAKPARTLAGLDPLTLAGTLCARMCHDLAGSLGALTGTLEMAAEDADREALALAVALAQEVAARLRLMRAAWGSGSDLPAPETLMPGLPGADRLRLDTRTLAVTDENMRRLSLNLLLVAASGLPKGGLIRMGGTNARLVLEIDGQRAGWPDALASAATNDQALLQACEVPRAAAVALACLHARALGLRINPDSATRLSAGA
jgi:histidine phosphotransferase ChpT